VVAEPDIRSLIFVLRMIGGNRTFTKREDLDGLLSCTVGFRVPLTAGHEPSDANLSEPTLMERSRGL
jgi:hypothetical protein